ncbi:MAG TPA: SHOCT domain-containing protein [Acidimicrobiales bacterium]|nr:SHOCT domain-containing protein [Acidimicrobiales bacterium]
MRPEHFRTEEVVVMMWYGDGNVAWWGWLLMSVGMVAFWGFVIWAVWAIASGMTRRPGGEPPARGAKELLDERLARGEIDSEEYRHLRDLMAGRDVHAGNGQATVGAGDRR